MPIHKLYKAFATQGVRSRWLGDVDLRVRRCTVEKSVRILWSDGTPLNAHFWAKGHAKSQVQIQHRDLPSRVEADRMRAFWTERLAVLTELLGSAPK